MKLSRSFLALGLALSGLGQATLGFAADAELGKPAVLASGLVNPESAVIGPDGRVYVSCIGERDKDGDGQVAVLVGNKFVPFATGLNDPKGIHYYAGNFYVADKKRVLTIDRKGKTEVFAAEDAFPKPALFLNDITADALGTLYVSDSGDRQGKEGKVFSINRSGKVTLVFDAADKPEVKMPNGVLAEGENKLLLADFLGTTLYRYDLGTKELTKIVGDVGAADGIVKDAAGNLFISDNKQGRVFRFSPGDAKAQLLVEGLESAADICMGPTGKSVMIPNMKVGSLIELPIAPASTVAPLITGWKNPESVALGPDGAFYVSIIGEFGKDGDGSIVAFTPGKGVKPFAEKLDDPKGLILLGDAFYVTDVKKVVKVGKDGKSSVFAAAEAFPKPPIFLNDIVADKEGNLFVSDSGKDGAGGAVYKINKEGKVSLVTDNSKAPSIKTPNGLIFDAEGNLLLADFGSGELSKVNQADGTLTKIAEGMPGADGLAWDIDGNLYISQWLTGKVHVLTAGSNKPKLYSNQFTSAADSCLDPKTGRIVIPDMRSGTLVGLPVYSPVPTVDDSPLPVAIEQAWPALTFDRPIVLTHANDGSKRTFLATQKGKIYILPEKDDGEEAKLFFDLSSKVSYKDNENEEGFLGFAFHPKFKENGQFFAYYTTKETPHLSIISRFKVTPEANNEKLLASEEEIMRIPQPYWNHNGGTICFGKDGYLYIGLGDGGAGNDPHGNGQNPKTVLGKLLRIDIDNKDGKKNYAVPKDNPFVGKGDAVPEAWATGVRNIWRMSFDRETGDCWVADVGQNIWEEINIVKSGDNLGWNPRESMHKFTDKGSPPKPEYVEPIWEYHHDTGKSITGGHVYRGQKTPELAGHYLYADYVTGRVWGLKYDAAKKQAVVNRPIFGNISPVMSFGEDEAGEVYFLTVQGRIYRFASNK